MPTSTPPSPSGVQPNSTSWSPYGLIPSNWKAMAASRSLASTPRRAICRTMTSGLGSSTVALRCGVPNFPSRALYSAPHCAAGRSRKRRDHYIAWLGQRCVRVLVGERQPVDAAVTPPALAEQFRYSDDRVLPRFADIGLIEPCSLEHGQALGPGQAADRLVCGSRRVAGEGAAANRLAYIGRLSAERDQLDLQLGDPRDPCGRVGLELVDAAGQPHGQRPWAAYEVSDRDLRGKGSGVRLRVIAAAPPHDHVGNQGVDDIIGQLQIRKVRE